MDLWTVVLKTVARSNSIGEFPYMVRAGSEAEAIDEAKIVHRDKYPKGTSDIKVVEVVLWATAV